MLDIGYVIATHDAILVQFGGLPGLVGGDTNKLIGTLGRVDNHAYYNGLDDVFGIAAMYGVAIACGHAFNDGNKRTALTCALAYLAREGYAIPRTPELEEVMVKVAEKEIDHETLADYLDGLWQLTQSAPLAPAPIQPQPPGP